MTAHAYVVATLDTRTAQVNKLGIYSADHRGLTSTDRNEAYALLYTTSGSSYASALERARQWIVTTHPALFRRFGSSL